jgi:NAD(P) transhydrogenase subunit alpha
MTLKIAIPRAWPQEEKRVALVPSLIPLFQKLGFSVAIEAGAGTGAFFNDQEYEGAEICTSAETLFQGASLVLFVGPPSADQIKLLPKGSTIVGMLGGLIAPPYPNMVEAFSLELLPRTSNAQSMDVLTSQSGMSGYWGVIQGASLLPRVLPMMTTPSGGLKPAHVLVLGAGVAGLQAIATAKRLGAVVTAFDVREAAKGAAESLGARFVCAPLEGGGETTQGYAQAMSADYTRAQHKLIGDLLPKIDVVVCTALIPGKEPPHLITQEMVGLMKPGSVIMDLATDRWGAGLGASGNCTLSRRGATLESGGVKIVGPSYGLSHLSQHASMLYARNLFEFVKHAWDSEAKKFRNSASDPLLKASCLSKDSR